MKLQMFLNIAACNLKTKDFETAVAACDEALRLDPYNIKGLYRRARGRSLPINSGVEDFRVALADLKRVIELDPEHKPALKELRRL
jgi:tetratricopeptide (TPR) repeat protein